MGRLHETLSLSHLHLATTESVLFTQRLIATEANIYNLFLYVLYQDKILLICYFGR